MKISTIVKFFTGLCILGMLFGAAFYGITKEICKNYSHYTQKQLDEMRLTKEECGK